jgi:hypothetical protein
MTETKLPSHQAFRLFPERAGFMADTLGALKASVA